MILSLLALAAVQTGPVAPLAQGEQARLLQCAALVHSAPQQALDYANAWLAEPGRHPSARRCLGLAFTALEQYPAAATVYEQAAHEAEDRQDPSRADFWVQAGNAWLAADQGPRALQAFDAALAVQNLAPALQGGAYLDRARAQVALGRVDRARQDLDRALQLVPAEPVAWYLSAALARRENNADRARTDIARARQLAPDDPDILLLAGTTAGQDGDMAEAERLYRRIVSLAPDSDAGRAAQASLATMHDVEVPAPAAAPSQQPAPPPHRR